MTIYGDIYLIINFSMDFICLYISMKALSLSVSIKRLSIAALIGSLFSLFLIVMNVPRIQSVLLTVPIGGLMCKIACGGGKRGKKLSVFLLIFSVYTAVSFFMAGGLTFLYSLANEFLPPLSKESTPSLIFPAALLCIIASICLSSISKRQLAAKKCTVSMDISGKRLTFSALVDSGNLLTEPISGQSVVILSKKISSEIDPYLNFDPLSLAEDSRFRGKVRVVPIKDVRFNGLLTAFSPDRITIEGLDKSCFVAMTSMSDFGGCDALIPSSLII